MKIEPSINPISQAAKAAEMNQLVRENAEAKLSKLQKACVDFEAVLIQQVFECMEKTLESGNLVGKGAAGNIYSGLLTEGISKRIAETQSWGIADKLLKDTLKKEPELCNLFEMKELEKAKQEALDAVARRSAIGRPYAPAQTLNFSAEIADKINKTQ